MPQIEVTFDIDANGILHVSAKDLGTGKEQKIAITASSGLSKDEIEKMRKDAESHAQEDREHREEIEVRNEADSSVYRTEKMLKDNAEKISADNKSKLESAVSEVKEALKSGKAPGIKSASEKLAQLWQTVSADLYKAAGQQTKAQGGTAEAGASGEGSSKSSGGKDEGPIIDAEVVDEKK